MSDKLKKGEVFMEEEDIQQMQIGELRKYAIEMMNLCKRYQNAYRIVPDGEYYLHREEHKGNVFYKIAVPKKSTTDFADEKYADQKNIWVKIVGMPEEYRDIPDKTRIKMIDFNEYAYKKGYDWIWALMIKELEVIPDNSKPEEKMDNFSIGMHTNGSIYDDDILF